MFILLFQNSILPSFSYYTYAKKTIHQRWRRNEMLLKLKLAH